MITSTGKRFMVVFADLDGDDMTTEDFATYEEALAAVHAEQNMYPTHDDGDEADGDEDNADGQNRKAIIIGVGPDGMLGTEDYT